MRNLVRRRIIWIEHWQKAVKENVQNQQSVNFYSLQTDAVAPSPILGRWLVLRAVERSKDRNDWCWQPCAMWYVRLARSNKLVHRWVVFVPTASAIQHGWQSSAESAQRPYRLHQHGWQLACWKKDGALEAETKWRAIAIHALRYKELKVNK